MSTPVLIASAVSTQAGTRRWCILLVLVALVVAQALGFMHRVVHTSHDADPSHAAAASSLSHDHAAGEHEDGWVDALFALHDDPTDCRLYDGLGPQVFACGVPGTPPAEAPALGYLRQLQGDFVARWAALFDARGPPVSR